MFFIFFCLKFRDSEDELKALLLLFITTFLLPLLKLLLIKEYYIYRINCTSLFLSNSKIIYCKLFFEFYIANVVNIIDFMFISDISDYEFLL